MTVRLSHGSEASPQGSEDSRSSQARDVSRTRPPPAADSAGEASDRMTGDPELPVAASPGEPEAVEKLDEATETEFWFG